jgi:hypothetical protein
MHIYLIIVIFLSLVSNSVLAEIKKEAKDPVMVPEFYTNSDVKKEVEKIEELKSLGNEKQPITNSYLPKSTISQEAEPKPTVHRQNEKQFHDKMMRTQKSINKGINAERVKKGQTYSPGFDDSLFPSH